MESTKEFENMKGKNNIYSLKKRILLRINISKIDQKNQKYK